MDVQVGFGLRKCLGNDKESTDTSADLIMHSFHDIRVR